MLGADRPGARVGALDLESSHQPAGVARRQVLRLHRRPAQRTPRRCSDVACDSQVPDGSTPEVIEVVRSATFLSPPAKRPPPSCSRRPCRCSAIDPTSRKSCARTAA